jgi:hypothetical protein
MCHARKERVLLFGTDQRITSGPAANNGCIERPDTWLHPNRSRKRPIFLLPRGRRFGLRVRRTPLATRAEARPILGRDEPRIGIAWCPESRNWKGPAKSAPSAGPERKSGRARDSLTDGGLQAGANGPA